MLKILKNLKKNIYQKNILKKIICACKLCLKSQFLYPIGKYSNFDLDACVKNYINNIETARYYANLSGAKYLNFLQPFNSGGKRQLSKFDLHSLAHMQRRMTANGDNELDLVSRFYAALWQKVKNKDYVHDLRNIFDSYNGEIYFDQVHCSDIGYDIIARKIADEIIKIEEDVSKKMQSNNKERDIYK